MQLLFLILKVDNHKMCFLFRFHMYLLPGALVAILFPSINSRVVFLLKKWCNIKKDSSQFIVSKSKLQVNELKFVFSFSGITFQCNEYVCLCLMKTDLDVHFKKCEVFSHNSV